VSVFIFHIPYYYNSVKIIKKYPEAKRLVRSFQLKNKK